MRLHTGMDARRSRLPEKPENIGYTAQKARKQGDGPPARGTRSPNKGIGTRRQPKEAHPPQVASTLAEAKAPLPPKVVTDV